MKARNPLILAVFSAATLLAGCNATDDRVESRLKSELPRLLGPATRYEVDVQGVDADASRADLVTVVGYGVRPRHGPAIDRLELELRDVRYDRHAKRLERVEMARATAWVSAADLADFLETQDGIRSASVELADPDSAYVRVRPDLGIPLPNGASVELAGTIHGRGPYVEYNVADVSALGGSVGSGISRRISRLINPLVDLSGLPIRLDVTRVRVEGRTIRMDADGEATAMR